MPPSSSETAFDQPSCPSHSPSSLRSRQPSQPCPTQGHAKLLPMCLPLPRPQQLRQPPRLRLTGRLLPVLFRCPAWSLASPRRSRPVQVRLRLRSCPDKQSIFLRTRSRQLRLRPSPERRLKTSACLPATSSQGLPPSHTRKASRQSRPRVRLRLSVRTQRIRLESRQLQLLRAPLAVPTTLSPRTPLPRLWLTCVCDTAPKAPDLEAVLALLQSAGTTTARGRRLRLRPQSTSSSLDTGLTLRPSNQRNHLRSSQRTVPHLLSHTVPHPPPSLRAILHREPGHPPLLSCRPRRALHRHFPWRTLWVSTANRSPASERHCRVRTLPLRV